MSEDLSSRAVTAELLGSLRLGEYWGMLRRRRWAVGLTMIVVFVATTVFAYRMPNVFLAETVIIVDPQQVPDKYVTSTVSNIGDRLSTLQQQILSPTRLKRLIDSMNLYPELKGRRSEQEVINTMQHAINVDVEKPGGAGRLSAFRIAYHGKNPNEVAQVANRLAQIFIEENLKVREQQSEGTAEFLEIELRNTKTQLDQKENELRQIKSSNVLELPESKSYHLEALTNLRNQLQASQDRAARAQQEEAALLQSLTAAQHAPAFVDTLDSDTLLRGSTNSAYQLQIQKLEFRLAELQARYGSRHPDVIKTQNELAQLRAKAAGEEAPTAPEGRRNLTVEAQIQKLDQEIKEQTRLQAQWQAEINLHTSKLERMPIFEQQIAGLHRDYDILRTHYASLLDKKLSAEMASALESHQKAERFVILDPAVPPDKPFAPNRALISLAGLFGGLLGGVVVGFMAEMNDEAVRSESEAAHLLGKPVLAVIPRIISKRERRWRRLRAIGALAGAAVCSAALGVLTSVVAGRF